MNIKKIRKLAMEKEKAYNTPNKMRKEVIKHDNLVQDRLIGYEEKVKPIISAQNETKTLFIRNRIKQ